MTRSGVTCASARRDQDDGTLTGRLVAGKYRLKRRIGSGGMGVVYEADHVELDRTFAVKLIRRDLASDTHAVARFRREARAAASLDCDHIASVYDVGMDESGVPYMVMDLLKGQTLRSLLDVQRVLEPAAAVSMGVQICRGLSQAHAVGIVHRDLKPANLFVCTGHDGTGRVKLLDFGIAKLRQNHDTTHTNPTAGPLGSLKYMAPEQARSAGQVDQRADLYSVGVILYEALAGVNPNEAEEPAAVLQRILYEQPLPLRIHAPRVPTSLCAVVSKAMAHKPEDRYPSAKELGQALASALNETGAAASSPKGWTARRRLVTAGAIALIGGLGLWVSQSGRSSVPRSSQLMHAAPITTLAPAHQLGQPPWDPTPTDDVPEDTAGARRAPPARPVRASSYSPVSNARSAPSAAPGDDGQAPRTPQFDLENPYE